MASIPGIVMQNIAAFAALAMAGAAAVLANKSILSKSKGRLPLPPGPPGLPIVGNAFDVPAEEFWWKYKEWSDQYGSDVIYLNILGTDIVVLNSLAACRELLEKRSAIYSSRPNMPMMNDLIGFDWNFAFKPYGEGWRERRKLFIRAVGLSNAKKYQPALARATSKFLLHVLDDPRNFRQHSRLLAGSFILDITYGLEVTSQDDTYITQAEKGMSAMAAAGSGSSYIVDFIPSLKILPSWFPGATFKQHAAAWRPDVLAIAREPLKYVEEAMREGTARESAAAALLRELDQDDEHFQEKKKSDTRHSTQLLFMWLVQTPSVIILVFLMCLLITVSLLYDRVSSINTFFLAMAQNPDIQAKGHAAVDKIITERGRLPELSDHKQLPYIEAIVREVLRWRPVVPIAVPHAVTQDDVYKSYRIPKGAMVIPNVYAIAHDPLIYGPNTHLFDPSRFLNPTQTEIREDAPMGYEAFGFGRRICPGLHIAMESIWLIVASVLSVFHISRAGSDGKNGDSDFGKYTSGLLIHPLPFEARIEPRSEAAEALIRNSVSST
ncbi:hypothetical protein NMY22_g13528 [Coprinellus aureogranulatus]|nr:hypothetical protein NMY22_g13528 [Coprinellus aureogranulatus]